MDTFLIGIAAGVSGAALGAGWVWVWLRQRHAEALAQGVGTVQAQYGAMVKDLRAAQTRLTLERERERLALPQQMAAAVAEQRAVAGRLEAQLKFAYLELDRLRGEDSHWGDDATDLSRGFAKTKSFDRLN